ncbi:prepilin-type N-terminal cleavage/methylation domain-containing protein [Candidatus Saccharibacteria bacterium]|nr:MAG: prepilin-type N-terminal cleavage/methylation domain-containing protein [Candidatus Saccharibacteria bacterium]
MHKKLGFTVVEILVVITVIGVISTVVVVAYRGVQERAYMAQVYTNVSNTAKLMNTYHTFNGTYPIVANTNCLGKVGEYPAANGFQAGSCGIDTANGSSWGQANDSLVTMLTTIGTVPSGAIRTSTNYGIKYRGVYFQINDYPGGSAWPDSVFFEFSVSGNLSCLGKPYIRRYDSSANTTYCSYYFDASGN